MTKFTLYLLRWQMSSPILAVALSMFESVGTLSATVIANLIGGCLFFFVDKWIFGKRC